MAENPEYLARGVIALVGNREFTGHQLQGVFLVEYDQSNDTYVGVHFPHNEQFIGFVKAVGKGQFAAGSTSNVTVGLRVKGLRRYPYAERPDYPFQFVLPGEDVTPLREIAKRATTVPDAPIEQAVDEQPVTATPTTAGQERWQQLGYESKQAWKDAGKL